MTHIPEALRRLVFERAGGNCEYCLLDQRDSLYTREVDHIVPTKHRGQTTADNLCLSYLDCNRHRGSDFASFDPDTGEVALLYNPRRDRWDDHFRLDGPIIEPVTPQGRVTVFLLKLNDELRIRARQSLMEIGHYPPHSNQ
jgi:hypothetical protein